MMAVKQDAVALRCAADRLSKQSRPATGWERQTYQNYLELVVSFKYKLHRVYSVSCKPAFLHDPDMSSAHVCVKRSISDPTTAREDIAREKRT